MKLKPEHITPYLPWDLQCQEYASKIDRKEMINSFIIGITMGGDSFVIDTIYGGITETLNPDEFKLILRPLSDYKDVNSKAMNELNCDLQDQMTISQLANGYISIDQVNYDVIKIMAKNHIDFNKLIPEGLAVDKNTLE